MFDLVLDMFVNDRDLYSNERCKDAGGTVYLGGKVALPSDD
jgi:hypothetical protein